MRTTSYAEYLKKAREIEKDASAHSRSLAVLSSFTADFLRPFLAVESHEAGCPLKTCIGPFNQFEQFILGDSSKLTALNPDVLWITMRLEDVDPSFVHEFPALVSAEARERIARIQRRLVLLAEVARKRFTGIIFVSNLSMSYYSEIDPFDFGNPHGLQQIVAEANRDLAFDLSAITDTFIFDFAGAMSVIGRKDWEDLRLWYMARVAVGPSAQKRLSAQFVRTVSAVLRPRAKCIVLDLDNTLWGGVIGDDGPRGIQLGDDYPGNAFKYFQQILLWYQRRGFLLATASKNNRETVLETLDLHPEMVLHSHHFAVIEANWDPKPQSLINIANKLNIGLDSLVFVDDNPVEREQVRVQLPMVQVVDLPTNPIEYADCLHQVLSLDRPRLVQEDRQRAEMYRAEAKRAEYSLVEANITDFLNGLSMIAEVGEADQFTIERIHQLVQKTNQFNLTTRRHSLESIQTMADRDDSAVAWLRLSDRFGDSGLVCVGIIKQKESAIWEIDTLLMSCRVMGRNVEDAFLAYLAELGRQYGAVALTGVYIATAKNKPVENFYLDHGFVETEEHGYEKAKCYSINLVVDAPVWPKHIQLKNLKEEEK